MSDDKTADYPLYVDLDGTLVNTDTLYESFIGVIKKTPLLLIPLLLLLLRKGKAVFKQNVASIFIPDSATLPYNKEIISFLQQEKQTGRMIVLATAADQQIASTVAKHTNLFHAIIASNGKKNLKGKNKLTEILAHNKNKPFGYIGDSVADMEIWAKSEQIVLAGKNRDHIKKRLHEANKKISHDFSIKSSKITPYIKAIRPHQWAKNLLIFTSIILAHKITHPELLLNTAIAFIAFCMCASGVYLFNDLLDIEADRHHKRKRHRPLAAGTLPLNQAILAIPVLLLISASLAALLPSKFQFILAGYFLITTGYTLYFKQIVLLDVIILSLLYTIRIVAGSAAINIETTPWLMGFSIFIFLSLALAKRYSELHDLVTNKKKKIPGRGYRSEDIEQLAIFGSSSGYLSILVLALYLNSNQVTQLYGNIEFLWLVCPIMTYWISRIWLLARRGELHDDPVVFTLQDKTSYLIGISIALLLFLAMV